jgi:hypothetical protein
MATNDFNAEIDRCISALEAVRLTRGHYASSEKGGELIREIIDMLGGVKDEGHTHPPLQKAIAQALHRSFVGPLPTE